jgi:hypothetical protein
MIMAYVGNQKRTKIRRLTHAFLNVQFEKVVSQRPVVAHVWIPVCNQALNAENLEMGGQDNATVQLLAGFHACDGTSMSTTKEKALTHCRPQG